MASLTLLRAGNPLADAATQRRVLGESSLRPFERTLGASGLWPLQAAGIRVLQVNVGKLCNQTCRHCHVDAGPDRREVMTSEMMDICLDVMVRAEIPVLDITGGAPEMNPNFRRLVARAGELDRQVIDRCNLTILLAPGFDDLPEFLASRRVEIVASLPCYLPSNTNRQRGDGVFEKSIAAIRRLNQAGYGLPDGDLPLTLVYNPVGLSLPPPQAELEKTYREELSARHGVSFTRLFTIANMPISRFLDDLAREGKLDEYMAALVRAYNPAAVAGLMCRTTLSVGWDGTLYDCDFNQMLELRTDAGLPAHIRDFDRESLKTRRIVTGPHCYGCTAGSGSSCGGAILPGTT